MSRATEDQLAALHKRVAESFVSALDQSTVAVALLLKYRDTQLPMDVVRFLNEVAEINPSLLTAATKFLKDNNISCDPSEDNNLTELGQQLAAKRTKNKGNVLSIPVRD